MILAANLQRDIMEANVCQNIVGVDGKNQQHYKSPLIYHTFVLYR